MNLLSPFHATGEWLMHKKHSSKNGTREATFLRDSQ